MFWGNSEFSLFFVSKVQSFSADVLYFSLKFHHNTFFMGLLLQSADRRAAIED